MQYHHDGLIGLAELCVLYSLSVLSTSHILTAVTKPCQATALRFVPIELLHGNVQLFQVKLCDADYAAFRRDSSSSTPSPRHLPPLSPPPPTHSPSIYVYAGCLQ